MQLLGEVGDIVLRHLSGVNVVLNGVVLSRQAEGVKADGEQHVVAVHPLFPGYYVHGGVGSGMSHMQPVARGIGELNQAVELRLGGIASLAGKGLFVLPLGLPLFLDLGKIVLQSYHALLYFLAGFWPKVKTIP